jgi:hypothetical protein
LREKYKIDYKVLFVDTGEGVIVRRVPKLSELTGILKGSKIGIAQMRKAAGLNQRGSKGSWQ